MMGRIKPQNNKIKKGEEKNEKRRKEEVEGDQRSPQS